MRRIRMVSVAAVCGALLLAGCGGGSSGSKSSASARPTTTARLTIVEPQTNAVTPPDITVRFELTGARIVAQATQLLRPDEGHIHLYLDNQLVSMNYTTTNDLHGLTPGPHTLRGEFVAGDHGPFRNPPIAAVAFKVQT